MSTQRSRALVVGLILLVGILCAQSARSQETLSLKLQPSGLAVVARGETELATIEFNAHGPEWKHASQETATVKVTDLPEGAGKRFTCLLPVPNTNGGEIRFVQTVLPQPRGFRLEYDALMTQDMKLNGVQVSFFLPVAQYTGQEMVVSRPEGDPEVIALPEERGEGGFQLWRGDGAKVEMAKGTPNAMTIELRAPADVVIQDLRQWERDVFEVRFPAIMEDPGREVFAGDRLHLDLTVTLTEAVETSGP